VCITGALTGNVAVVDHDLDSPAFVNQHVALIRPRLDRLDPTFLALALRSKVGQEQFKAGEYGGTKQGLGLADVKSVKIAVPSLAEQTQIVEYVRSSRRVLEAATDRAKSEISLLREFRTRLTADVVTGQLDIRDAAARLPQLDPAVLVSDVGTDEDELDAELARSLEEVDA